MIKLFKTLFLKYVYSYRFLAMGCIVILSVTIYSIGMLNFAKDITLDNFEKNLLLSFFSQILLPIGAIIITAMEIGEDLESGCGKFFLISKISKVNYLLSKILFVLTTMIVITILTCMITSFIGVALFHNSGINFQVLQGVGKTFTGVISIVLGTAIIALITCSFQNTLIISIGLYLSMLVIDQIFPQIQFTLTYNISNPLKTNSVNCAIAMAYSLLFLIVSMSIMKKKDVVI